ncbi:MAG: RNA-binding S4 domain-containing protein [Hyphomicrobiaceae bacterium]
MSADADDDDSDAKIEAGAQRLDKWLWFARVAKTRTLSAALISEGKVRVNGVKVIKPAHTVKVGDTVTVVMRQRMRILKVAGIGARRGGADVAALLFEDRSPTPVVKSAESGAGGEPAVHHGHREPGSGRPTKRERRELDRLKFRSG